MPAEKSEGLATVIDYDQLLTRCLNNIDFAERMLSLFENRCGQELAALEEALDKGDLDLVRRLAHRFAGASANAAALALQSRASQLRHAAIEGSREKSEECLHELRSEWKRFSAAFAAERQSVNAS